MPENLPRNPTDALDWIRARAQRWIDHAGEIGLSEAFAQEIRDLAEESRIKRREADEAASRAKAATLAWRISIRHAMDRTRAAIGAIKTHAAVTQDPGVYALAGLSPRDKPGDAGPPEAPSSPRFVVRPGGAVEISWDGGGPQGTFYVVKRALPGEQQYTIMGTTTSRRFTDETLHVGVGRVHYAIDAQHGRHLVRGDVLPVQLGSKGGSTQEGGGVGASGRDAA
ncbi:MAG: hypothetical protein RIE77_08370 [Phycisphaerales bacterium]|jgi:hypothetical protein